MFVIHIWFENSEIRWLVTGIRDRSEILCIKRQNARFWSSEWIQFHQSLNVMVCHSNFNMKYNNNNDDTWYHRTSNVMFWGKRFNYFLRFYVVFVVVSFSRYILIPSVEFWLWCLIFIHDAYKWSWKHSVMIDAFIYKMAIDLFGNMRITC